MTLLDRISRSVLLFVVFSGLLACEDPSEVGLSLNSDGTQIGVFFEEIPLPVTNVFIDSLRTDADRRFLVGKYNDPVFGSTTSTALTQLSPTSFVFTAKDDSLTSDGKEVYDYEIDSVILQLRYNYFHGSNLTGDQEIQVRQINDTLFSGVSYFAHFPAASSQDDLLYGENTFQVNAEVDTLLKVNLDSFGEETLKFLRSAQTSALSADSITNQLKGIALIPGENNSGILGFDPVSTDSKLSVYYKIIQIESVQSDSTITDSLSINFTFANSVRYNSTSTDRSAAEMNIVKDNLAQFDAENGKVYLQSGTGVYPRLDFTPFKRFLDEQSSIIVNRTDIVVPVAMDVTKPTYISDVDDFRLFLAKDSSNVSNSAASIILSNSSYLNSGISAAALASKNTEDNTYEVETSLFSQLVNSGGVEVENLILIPSDIGSMNQTIFDKEGAKIRVYYTIPK